MSKGCMERFIENANFQDTGFSYTMSLISGKHKMVILYCLMEYQPVRFNEMKRYLGKITDKTLSGNLKELEADGLIARQGVPPDPAQGGVLPDGPGEIPDGGAGPAVRVGGAEPPLRRIIGSPAPNSQRPGYQKNPAG